MPGAGRRILAVALNTYREAVRARILLGLVGLSLATALYSIAIGEFALKNSSRVVADLGAASISIYAILAAIIFGGYLALPRARAKNLVPRSWRVHRPRRVLGGQIHRDAAHAGGVHRRRCGRHVADLGPSRRPKLGGRGGGTRGADRRSVGHRLAPTARANLLADPLGYRALGGCCVLASGAPDDRRVVLGASSLAFLEVMIVSGIVSVFSAFSSPFLSAMYTVGVFIVGREADTLARLPLRVFGSGLKHMGAVLATIVPNLQVYVPPRPLLTGEAPNSSLAVHLGWAALQALGWSTGLLVVSSHIFRRRDLL